MKVLFLQQKSLLLLCLSVLMATFTQAQVKLNVKNDSVYVSNSTGKTLLAVDAAGRLKVDNRLGIGTASPSAPLHIVGATNGVQQIIKLPSSQTQANPIWQVLDSAGRILVELRAQTNIRSNGLRSVNQFFGDSSGINTIVAEGVDSGAYNSGFGYKALASNVRGKANTAIGSEALKANVTGSFNSGFGQGALMSMISGSDNLGIGQKSLPTYTTGNQNVGIGNNVADGNLSGSDNVMIGYWSGKTPNGTGSQNVYIGSSAGRVTSTTASGNVLIGYNVGNGLTVGNNKLYIANSNTSNPLIYGEFDNNVLATSGKLGVGTQVPEQKLHVKGQVKIDTITTSTNGTDSNLVVNNGIVKKVAAEEGPVVLAKGTVTNTATLDIDMSAYYNLYDIIEIKFYAARPVTNTVDLYMRVSTNAVNYAATGYKWNLSGAVSSTGANISDASTGIATGIQLIGSCSNVTERTANGVITIHNAGSSTFFPTVSTRASNYNTTPAVTIAQGTGVYTTAQVTKAVRLYFSSGNISTISYKVIGYKN